jgi:polyhydroxyalkanoate synthesis regulator phasin
MQKTIIAVVVLTVAAVAAVWYGKTQVAGLSTQFEASRALTETLATKVDELVVQNKEYRDRLKQTEELRIMVETLKREKQELEGKVASLTARLEALEAKTQAAPSA